MRSQFICLFLLGVMLFAAVSQEQAVPTGEAWLALIDSGKYMESWSESSTLFRTQLPAQKWAEMAGSVRGSLGAKKSRKLKSVNFAKTLPGVPDGNYAVIQFDAAFANKANAVETLTVMEDAGQWRAAGYFIK
jgi:Protein of unknown function (DUF4019)